MKHSRKKLLLIAGGVIALIFVYTGPTIVRGWHQKESFDKFFSSYSQALVKGDLQWAYDTSGPEFRAATPFVEFVRLHKQLANERGDLVSVRKGRTVVEGTGKPLAWVAVTTASLTFRNSSVNLTYEFHFDDDGWHLFGFREAT